MKTGLIILIGLLSNIANAQLNQFIGTWITPDNEFLEISDTTNKYSNYLEVNGRNSGLAIFLLDDTLSFQNRYYSSATNYEKLYINRYDFKVLTLNDTNLKVQTISKFSKEFFQGKDTIAFTRQEYAVDENINFEKLTFHTTYCYGSCPTYHLELDKNQKIKLFAEEVFSEIEEFEIDSSKTGYFKGELNDTVFNKIIHLLKTCNLNSLHFDGVNCCDGSIFTIIIYYNGQRKYLKSMFPPKIADKLISNLYNICNESSFERTKEEFEIEK